MIPRSLSEAPVPAHVRGAIHEDGLASIRPRSPVCSMVVQRPGAIFNAREKSATLSGRQGLSPRPKAGDQYIRSNAAVAFDQRRIERGQILKLRRQRRHIARGISGSAGARWDLRVFKHLDAMLDFAATHIASCQRIAHCVRR